MSELSDFLKLMAEEKKRQEEQRANSLGGKAIKEVQERLKQNNEMGDLLEVFVEGKKPGKTVIVEKVVEKEVIVEKEVLNKDSFQQPKPQPVDPNITGIQKKIQFLEQAIGKIAATGPGSGEVNFRWLDDVNRSTMESGNNNWLLEYDSVSKKVQFTNQVGPIEWVRFDRTHVHEEERIPGTLCWSEEDRALNVTQTDGVVLQVGQESFVLAKNTTGATIPNGAFVRFAGASLNGEARILVAPFLANGEYPNLYGLGIATQTIVDGENGFITDFGKVREIDTTGTSVGETWQLGDILYAHPTVAGALTRNKPTAPQNVIPVAAVLLVDDEEGEIFVRPTFEQKLAYGLFVDTTNQQPAEINTPYAITYNTTQISDGVVLGTPSSRITVQQSGLFNFVYSLSITSTNSSAKNIFVWARKNGVDIPLSTLRKSITGNGTYDRLVGNVPVSLIPGDYIEFMYGADNTAIIINAPPATAFAPSIPSATVTVTQLAL
jgi:hypothetical protein